MLKELIHHVGVHIAQHPKETAATAIAGCKAAVPIFVRAHPYVIGDPLVAGVINGVGELTD